MVALGRRRPTRLQIDPSRFKNNNQNADGAKQDSHDNALVFLEDAELDFAQAGQGQRSEYDHACDGRDRQHRRQDSKAGPAITDSGNVKWDESFAGRKGQEREQTENRGAIRSGMGATIVAMFIVVFVDVTLNVGGSVVMIMVVPVVIVIVISGLMQMFVGIMEMNVSLSDHLPK